MDRESQTPSPSEPAERKWSWVWQVAAIIGVLSLTPDSWLQIAWWLKLALGVIGIMGFVVWCLIDGFGPIPLNKGGLRKRKRHVRQERP